MSTEAELEIMGRELVAWLIGRTYGQVRVVAAAGEVIVDVDGYTTLSFTATLTNPSDETWPFDDVAALGRDVRAKAQGYPEAPFVYLSLKPETEEMQADEIEESRSA